MSFAVGVRFIGLILTGVILAILTINMRGFQGKKNLFTILFLIMHTVVTVILTACVGLFLGHMNEWSFEVKALSWVVPAWFFVTSALTGIGLWQHQGLTPWELVHDAKYIVVDNPPAQAMIRSMELLAFSLILQLLVWLYG
jgi:hypothetical protein